MLQIYKPFLNENENFICFLLLGSTYTWGIYDITYVGVDTNRNADYCNFRLYVKCKF
jgi:hypothetical protein